MNTLNKNYGINRKKILDEAVNQTNGYWNLNNRLNNDTNLRSLCHRLPPAVIERWHCYQIYNVYKYVPDSHVFQKFFFLIEVLGGIFFFVFCMLNFKILILVTFHAAACAWDFLVDVINWRLNLLCVKFFQEKSVLLL